MLLLEVLKVPPRNMVSHKTSTEIILVPFMLASTQDEGLEES